MSREHPYQVRLDDIDYVSALVTFRCASCGGEYGVDIQDILPVICKCGREFVLNISVNYSSPDSLPESGYSIVQKLTPETWKRYRDLQEEAHAEILANTKLAWELVQKKIAERVQR